MKKTFMLLVAFCFATGIYAQQSIKDLVINPLMYEQFGQTQIEKYMQTDPAELIRLNYKMANYACVAGKMIDGDYQILGSPDQYANPGVQVDEEEIIRNGYLNPFQYQFPQDDYKCNVFPLHHNGYYVFVLPKNIYDERVNAQLHRFGF